MARAIKRRQQIGQRQQDENDDAEDEQETAQT